MFTEFTFKRFKSFKDSTLPVSPLTIIIGSNASGKSNAIEGIGFLAKLGRWTKVSDIITGIRGQVPGIRGGSEKVAFVGNADFELGCKLELNTGNFDYSIKVEVKPEIEMLAEKLILIVPDKYDTLIDVDEKKVKAGGLKFPSDIRKSGFSLLGMSRSYGGSNDIPAFASYLDRIFTYDPVPVFMKDYVNISDNILKPNAENVSAVIAKLIDDKKKYEILLEMLQDLPEQQIKQISLAKVKTDEIEDVMLVIEEKLGDNKVTFSARNLSDGTLRFIAIISALLSMGEGTTLTIEEIDTGIHPARLQKMLAFISQIAREKNMSVIATTHNPALLNALSREDIPGVVVCYRDPVEGDSRFVRLVDLPSYPELMAAGRLGDLLTTGLIEKAAHETEEDRTREYDQKMRWIEEELQ